MPQPSTNPKTVIIAVNDSHTIERFTVALQSAGHHTIEARTQAELIAHVLAPLRATDLIVLDLRLGGSGVETARMLKTHESKTSIIILSGSIGNARDVRELAALGIDSYVNECCADQYILPSLAPCLFPDSFNRRTSTRVTLDLPVAFRFADTIATAPTLNLSKGGLGIRTMTPLGTGTKVHVRFRLPGSTRDINANARVAWSDHHAGMGLQFEEVGIAEQSAVDEFVDQHAARS
jgi:uncharacterized protein (TIGR02266 family)